MKDESCVEFMQWFLPRLHMQWPGFKKVRGQVCKRIQRRLGELKLADTKAYCTYLENNRSEWKVLDGFCRITISRFYRDKEMFACLYKKVIPVLAHSAVARGEKTIRIWSAGCGSGEEPFSLALLWNLVLKKDFPEMGCHIIATDIDPGLLQRAGKAYFPQSSVKELPEEWLSQEFSHKGTNFFLLPRHRDMVSFIQQDIRQTAPEGPFHLVLCRNLAFTYYDTDLQQKILKRIHDVLMLEGALIIGTHESLPPEPEGFSPWTINMPIFRKVPIPP